MNNTLFYNNSLLSKLYQLLSELTEDKERDMIAQIIRNNIPSKSDYYFSAKDLSGVTVRAASCHSKGVSKCIEAASDYIFYLTGKGMDDFHFCDDMYCFIIDNYEKELYNMKMDFQVTRSYLFNSLPEEIKKDNIETFDLYIVNAYIDKYTQIINQYELSNHKQIKTS
jgi:hypothetical protein